MPESELKLEKRKAYLSVAVFTIIGLLTLGSVFFGRDEGGAQKSAELEILGPPPFVDKDWLQDSLRASEEFIAAETEVDPLAELDPGLLLPDLITRSMDKVYIETGPGAAQKTLRFSSANTNIGDGALEVRGEPDAETNTTIATQKIHRADGTFEEFEIGRFVYHPDHSHWHFEDFIIYELYEYDDDGVLGEKLTETGKLTFCLYDTLPAPGDFPNRPASGVYVKCRTDTQGISSGWTDIYDADVAGQELDITGVPDGRYAFRSVINPDNLIIEKSPANNTDLVYIEIAGNRVTVLSEP